MTMLQSPAKGERETCYIERSKVRELLLGSMFASTDLLLQEVDKLPIFDLNAVSAHDHSHFTPDETALLKHCLTIAAEDGSIYPEGTSAEQKRVNGLIEAIKTKLAAVSAQNQRKDGER